MAPLDLQELALAIRTHFGPKDNLIKLSELLFYIESVKEPLEKLKKPSLEAPHLKVRSTGAPKRATVSKTRKLHTTKPIADRSQATAQNSASASPTEAHNLKFTFTANQI